MKISKKLYIFSFLIIKKIGKSQKQNLFFFTFTPSATRFQFCKKIFKKNCLLVINCNKRSINFLSNFCGSLCNFYLGTSSPSFNSACVVTIIIIFFLMLFLICLNFYFQHISIFKFTCCHRRYHWQLLTSISKGKITSCQRTWRHGKTPVSSERVTFIASKEWRNFKRSMYSVIVF